MSKQGNNAVVIKQSKKPINLKRFIILGIFIVSIGYILYYLYGEYKVYNLNKELLEQHNEYEGLDEAYIQGVNLNTFEQSVDSLMSYDSESEDVEIDIEQERLPMDVLPSMRPFFKSNKDTVGWIKVNGTNINNVVVQGKDNDYYLHKDFRREESKAGSIFVDYRCNICDYDDKQSQTIILYGHKQANGTMFGTLHKYNNDIEFYKQNPTFQFKNLFNTYTYKIISMFVIACNPEQTLSGEVFDYQNYINLTNDGEYTFIDFVNNIKSRSQLNIPVDIRRDDKFMILSTCSYEFNDARFVVIGRRVREGEDRTVDVDRVVENIYQLGACS